MGADRRRIVLRTASRFVALNQGLLQALMLVKLVA
jgi:hypothetical protein